MNALYYGDNLDILRKHIKDESVDLIYLDPPFNSNANYNVLFKSHKGHASDAQITAFEDTWHWSEPAEQAFSEILKSPNTDVAEMIRAFRSFLGESDMMAYLTMMAVRLLELYRALKPTGSIYLHCDPTASHYLKIMLDSIFGVENFQNEIIWKRTSSQNNPRRWGPVHDVIFLYGKCDKYKWNKVMQSYSKEYLEAKYKYHDERGTYRLDNLTASGVRSGSSGEPWRGYNPTILGRHWAVSRNLLLEVVGEEEIKDKNTQEKLDILDENGFIYWTLGKGGKAGFPQFKRYVLSGQNIQDVVTDIFPINSQAQERLGYPTQKPLALLERIIQASSNEGDVVLDPFCGCGTAVHAAQKLNRQWIGIDITHLAIALIEKRLKDAFKGITFEVHGTPRDLDGARDLAERDKYQFQWWACSLVNAQPYGGKKKGADGGIDGLIFFQDEKDAVKKIVVSVKGGGNISVAMVRDLGHVVDREKAAIGLFVTLAPPTKPMQKEAAAAGFYESPAFPGQPYPKLQILTIEGLLSGHERARFPDMAQGALTFKKAAKEKAKSNQGELF